MVTRMVAERQYVDTMNAHDVNKKEQRALEGSVREIDDRIPRVARS